ncbi:ABC transporter ATP-binding protein [Paenalcaligenes niemegkensis]|uniref:ABC transporter ATP-binding protein n=1 Tax=Paenalcaligenes niemegkensis TaxID=2895469 RepID=UPI001EE7F421|nr:ABC transporter ATP-binding protein [Paenalcaligenes niemegkensis]MCQ9618272.1 ABC transporter ATP-binding protein [Paenalcaligenes niemegkensis]
MPHVKVKGLTVEMPVYELSSRSMKLRLLGSLAGSRISSNQGGVTVVKALQDINFECEDGDRVGLIGSNGSGKSTLLRVLAGIYEPSVGQVQVDGKAVALLEMGLGMDDSLTGYQNIKLRGMLLGMSPDEVAEKTAEIAEFTSLGDYLHLPIRAYSSGMRIRLAFAISTAVEAELLLLDEVIGVGDAAFLEKANARLRDFQERASIVFIASHSGEVISDMCNKVMWLEGGQLRFMGDVAQGLKAYSDSLTH